MLAHIPFKLVFKRKYDTKLSRITAITLSIQALMLSGTLPDLETFKIHIKFNSKHFTHFLLDTFSGSQLVFVLILVNSIYT